MYKSDNIKIQECLLNIDMICRSMYLSYEETLGLKIGADSAMYADLHRYRYIQLCTILDEIEILNRIAKSDSYLMDTLYVISPVTRALGQFPGIKRARNSMFAHFNRDKKRNFHPWWIALRGLRLPQTANEIGDIYKYLHLMNAFLVSRYYEDLKEISVRTKPDFEAFFISQKEMSENHKNDKAVFETVSEAVLKKLEEKNIADQLILDPVMTKVIDHINNSRERIKRFRE